MNINKILLALDGPPYTSPLAINNEWSPNQTGKSSVAVIHIINQRRII